MRRMLVAVDGSRHGEAAAAATLLRARREAAEIHLLNVQPPLSRNAAQFLDGDDIGRYRAESAARELAGARAILDRAGLPFAVHIHVGEAARTIAEAARELRVAEIVMGAGDGLSLGDVAQRLLVARVIRRADAAVVVVKSPARPASTRPLDWRRFVYLR